MITVVALSPSVDVTYVVDELVLGEVHRPRSVHREAGGKALNAARAAASLGARVGAVAALWGATGEFVAQRLADAGVELRRVGGALETRTCVSIAAVGAGGAQSGPASRMTELYERATPVSDAEWQSILGLTRELILDRPGWLAVAGSVPDGPGEGALARLVGLGADAGLAVAIDAHGAALGAAVDARPALIKVNRSEAAALLGRGGAGDGTRDGAGDDGDGDGVREGEGEGGGKGCGDLLALAEAIHERSRGMVVVTDGVAGSVAVDGVGRWRVSPSDVTGAFSVGSGDSFLGGMLAALDDGADLPSALRLGAGCATANALEPGAARFAPQRARSIAAALTVERVR